MKSGGLKNDDLKKRERSKIELTDKLHTKMMNNDELINYFGCFFFFFFDFGCTKR